MTSLTKSKSKKSALVPRFNHLMEDFWGADKFFSDNAFPWTFSNKNVPSVNIKETKTGFDIDVAAPGMKKSDFDVSVENGILNISAEQEETKEEKTENYTRREFNYNSFERSFSLPENVDPDNIKANYEGGVLKLNLKKLKTKKSSVKKIPIA